MTIEQMVQEYRRHLRKNQQAGVITEQEVEELTGQYEKDLLWEITITN